ncbi:hypothetical protein L9F63_012178, partial [Diploptera punctata]
ENESFQNRSQITRGNCNEYSLQNNEDEQYGKKLFKCPKCEKSYSHRRSLWRHTNQECGQEPRFQCPYCPSKSKHRFTIYTHIKHFRSLSPSTLHCTYIYRLLLLEINGK